MNRIVRCQARYLSTRPVLMAKKQEEMSVVADTTGYVRLFGYRYDNNVLHLERKRTQNALLTFLLTPLYAVPFTSLMKLNAFCWIDPVSLYVGLGIVHVLCGLRIWLVRQYYPHVFEVLFNPYSGDVILKSESWADFVKASFSPFGRKPRLVSRQLPREEATDYEVFGTSKPQGMVIQRKGFVPKEGALIDSHLGFVHYANIFNDQPFDNYLTELAAQPLLNKMIDIRLGQERDYQVEDFKYGPNAHLVQRDDEMDIPNVPRTIYEAEARKQEFEAAIKDPFFNPETKGRRKG